MMEEKTFFLENEGTSKSNIIIYKIPRGGNSVDLHEILNQVPDPDQKKFKIYNAEKDEYEDFGSETSSFDIYTIPRDLLKMKTILIKFKDSFDEFENDGSSESEESNKKERSRERTIKEVIELIQKWRNYHSHPPDGKKKNLQEAAKFVGVSKKSLDDYYYQLRIGEKHEFDFTAHLDDKIGVLRAFLKIKEPERKPEGRNSKHPKVLKIIEEFSNKLKITETSNSNSSQNQENHELFKTKIEEDNEIVKVESPCKNEEEPVNSIHDPFESLGGEEQLFWGSPFTPLSQEKYMDCERNFYNEFDFAFEDPVDPYLPFTELMSKKSNDELL